MGGKQLGFSDYELTTAKKQTKREKFLSEMDVVVPWQALIELIEPHYPKTSKKGGRPPYPLATMLRIHLLQQWYSLSDPAMEEALIEVPTIRRFAGIELISDRIPDETTILTFRLTWTPKPEPMLMRASPPARLGKEKPHESQTPQPRADHPQVAHR